MADGEGKEVEGGENSEEGEEGAGEEGETKKITQRILATMADFLDGTYKVVETCKGHMICVAINKSHCNISHANEK